MTIKLYRNIIYYVIKINKALLHQVKHLVCLILLLTQQLIQLIIKHHHQVQILNIMIIQITI
jgi:hypothetical protein